MGGRVEGRSGLRLAALAAAALGASAALAPVAAAQQTVADNGFRAAANGFGFPNYGTTLIGIDQSGAYFDTGQVAANLGTEQMQALFGRAVCTTTSGPCTLTPPAAQWMESANEGMAGGHCYGFAVSVSRGYEGNWAPATFGGATVPGLQIDGNVPLQSLIGYGMAQQWVTDIVLQRPSAALATLRDEYLAQGKQALLVILKADMTGGHAITPYAIDDLGGGIFEMKVYDNNFPGQERSVRVDTNADTWSYQASQNPSNPAELYTGDATTRNIGVVDPDSGAGTSAFPPKGGGEQADARVGAARGETMRLMWSGDATEARHGGLLVQDERGRRTGCSDGPAGQVCRNEIPGAQLDHQVLGALRPWRESPQPRYTLPASSRYRVTLSGVGLRRSARESVAMVGDDSFVEVEGVDLGRRQRDRIEVEPYARGISFRAHRRADRVQLDLGTSGARNHHAFDLSVDAVPAGSTVAARIDRSAGDLRVDATRSRAATYRLRIERTTGNRRRAMTTARFRIPAGATLRIDYAGWRVGRPLTGVLDRTPDARGGASHVRLG